ncbi:lysozyme inhibitor LprI family protein [Lelliottia wanjuensis]|uniref:lysozyme inhibitor LprI family protein n=1 Tax=Lelliottia wanjuensis TaxID=3050585 RepID=UPI002550EF68|nr:lysozyme inhibitor LprI family protein [Lelliottia sp. V104_15]MDK9604627.1 lysozyme inhibitor LprI family protein [Lelliottia sp. V104_15]
MMKRILAIILLYSSFSHGADVCRNVTASDQVDSCLKSKKDSADKYLNEQYSMLLSKVNSEYINDESLKLDFVKNIKKSQRDWIKFRDSNCKLYSFQIDNKSSAYETTINECVAKMSETRGKELAELAANI